MAAQQRGGVGVGLLPVVVVAVLGQLDRGAGGDTRGKLP